MNQGRSTAEHLGRLATLACLMEASAPKVGNVSRTSPQTGTSLVDYFRSSLLLGGSISGMLSDGSGPGHSFHIFCEEMMQVSQGGNTHLGTALLLFPLSLPVSELLEKDERFDLDRVREYVQGEFATRLNAFGPGVTREFLAGIMAARPAGISTIREKEMDLADPELAGKLESSKVGLVEWMAAGSDVNMVADELAHGFTRTFDSAYALTHIYEQVGLELVEELGMAPEEIAIVQTHLALLASEPDTHVAGKNGSEEADWLVTRAAQVMEMGGVFQPNFRSILARLDTECRIRNVNPGATADILGGGIFLSLVSGGFGDPDLL